jgi:hypothetical protein
MAHPLHIHTYVHIYIHTHLRACVSVTCINNLCQYFRIQRALHGLPISSSLYLAKSTCSSTEAPCYQESSNHPFYVGYLSTHSVSRLCSVGWYGMWVGNGFARNLTWSIRILSRNLSRGTEEIHQNPRSGQRVSYPRFEARTCQVWIYSFTARPPSSVRRVFNLWISQFRAVTASPLEKSPLLPSTCWIETGYAQGPVWVLSGIKSPITIRHHYAYWATRTVSQLIA